MNTEFNVRHIEAPQELTNPQVPTEGVHDPKDVNAVLQNREEDSTTASLVAVYSDLLMLHALAVDHFQKPADEVIQPQQKKNEEEDKTT
jgi:hypothetical protein